MALQKFYVGTSARGDLAEAIRDALEQARQTHEDKFKWVVDKIAENQLTFPPLSVRIFVGGGRGDGGVGPKRPG
jgi:hypothetical protein